MIVLPLGHATLPNSPSESEKVRFHPKRIPLSRRLELNPTHGATRRRFWAVTLTFSLATPLAIFIGYGLSEVRVEGILLTPMLASSDRGGGGSGHVTPCVHACLKHSMDYVIACAPCALEPVPVPVPLSPLALTSSFVHVVGAWQGGRTFFIRKH